MNLAQGAWWLALRDDPASQDELLAAVAWWLVLYIHTTAFIL
jgi:hypothetical protein